MVVLDIESQLYANEVHVAGQGISAQSGGELPLYHVLDDA